MGKRSNFKRVERDFYPTPKEAVIPLIRHLPVQVTFAEPCVGNWDLAYHLFDYRHVVFYGGDIQEGFDALKLTDKDIRGCDYIITNPPWTRSILHPMIEHFRNLRPTWLLIDANWMFTKQAKPYLKYCKKIVNIGRVKWIPDSKHTGKDDCCWYLFDKEEVETVFVND